MLEKIYNWLVGLWNNICEFFSGLGQLIYDSISWFFTSFYEWIVDSIASPINSLLSSFSLNYSFSWASEIYQTINFFVPLNEMLTLGGVLFLFWLSVFALKICLKLIPTVY